ncbi:hypothetical protein EKN56_12770 [Limnobaculum zhutongyuii]|uniref:Uncharacterized protein n=1 Tax=Limnobaculum zhutongyuii TaxID=2498113 RepID=A0A411WLS6_9GAMM|nr:hypothetical protein [Limnobaculum zhutongyuii]QBH97189.1 hypothetical protein EKN56_12770 [Limnobaculum zhutongyuii]TQS88448.1 hypothetical protein ELQ32_10555 [Limnobaculum zhutongyuii]
MKKIKRYTPDYHVSLSHEGLLMRESENGEYIKYEDYELLINKSNSLEEFKVRVNYLLEKHFEDDEAIRKLSFTLGLIMGFTSEENN